MDDLDTLEATADCLEALGNSTRLAIYRLLVRAGPEGLPVGAIQQELGIPGSTLTHHLNRLLWVELIEQRRQGRQLICSAAFECLDQVLNFIVRECCAGKCLTSLPGEERGDPALPTPEPAPLRPRRRAARRG